MTRENILKNLRRTLIIQLIVSAVVLLLCWVMGWFYLYTIGMVFTWAGVLILLVNIFLAFGGILSGGEDLAAFSLSGAGKMDDHFKHMRGAGAFRVVFIIFGLINSFIPILIGYTLQTLGQ